MFKVLFINLSFLFLALGVSLDSNAATSREVYANGACAADDLATEPLARTPNFVSQEWATFFTSGKPHQFFDPVSNNADLRKSGITRREVSSSHIVNIIADGLRNVNKTVNDLIKAKKYAPIQDGKTYSADEFDQKFAEAEKVRRTHVDPLLSQLYKVYIDALKNKLARADAMQVTPAYNSFMQKARDQRDLINQAISKIAPSILQKLGEVSPVTGSDLPFSYRDGYVVKIRFQKPNSPSAVTVYPTLLFNGLTGEDEDFIRALTRWSEYTQGQWEVARSLMESGRIGNAYNYIVTYLSYKTGSADFAPDQILALAPYMKEAYEKSVRDLAQAKWVHSELLKLSDYEMYQLLDLFRALRYGDMVKCQKEITVLNDKVRAMLGTEKDGKPSSSASKKFSADQKNQIDSLAKDVAFYQDMYKVYSTAAAKLIVQKQP